MASSVKDRVFAAAEQISAERRPTVSTVRAAAGVSNAHATRHLEEKQAAGGQVAATPPALLEQAACLAGACWAEVSSAADERHAAAEAAWAQEEKDLNTEVAELVADLDKTSAEKESVVADLSPRVSGLESELAAAGEQLARPQAAEREARMEAAAAGTRVAAAEACAGALQEAHDGLQCITPDTTSGAGQDTAPGAERAAEKETQ